ncbi:hypothetical protein [Neisseria arctica]|uniref:hypothetical protein n=1 Tax=Neisseria arctica TaxID=1470200 RepID=UPI0006492975|nr:hypothetical protein [Neisseria arctica]UOO87479.1 hypothetical protein LVJ86_04340 [Neisseria arctica]
MNYDELREYVKNLFEGKVDKGGRPYFRHCLRVAKNSTDSELGLLHDVMEDCGVTREELLNLGLREKLVDAVEAITKKKGESYDDYINRIISFAEETRWLSILSVKQADLVDNMDVSRLPVELTQKDFERLKKYRKAYAKIVEAEERIRCEILAELSQENN